MTSISTSANPLTLQELVDQVLAKALAAGNANPQALVNEN